MLSGKGVYEFVKELGEDGLPLLKCARGQELEAMLRSSNEEERMAAALHLGAEGRKEALAILETYIARRQESNQPMFKNSCVVPVWKAAIGILGFAKRKEAAPLIMEVLKDRSSDQTALILSMRALASIGCKERASLIKELIARQEVPDKQQFQRATMDTRWKIELAAASSLALLGEQEEARRLASGHLDDARAYVRRAAKTTLAKIEAP